MPPVESLTTSSPAQEVSSSASIALSGLESGQLTPEQLTPGQHYRVPRENFSTLIVPEIPVVIQQMQAARPCHCQLHNVAPLDLPLMATSPEWIEKRKQARAETLQLITAYEAQLFPEQADALPNPNTECPALQAPWIVTGHQPEMSHPGVWYKNFVATHLAGQVSGLALNLIVDHDELKHPRLTLPTELLTEKSTGTTKELAKRQIRFTSASPSMLWEQIELSSLAELEELQAEITQQLRAWNITPFWNELKTDWESRASRVTKLVDAIVLLRKMAERNWGCQIMDLPVSRLSETAAFGEFVLTLAQAHRAFSELYNAAIQQYRVTYGLKSQTHPIPMLKQQQHKAEGAKYELPFWVVHKDHMGRDPLYVSTTAEYVRLESHSRIIAQIPIDQPATWPVIWKQLLADGWGIRPRALTLTLFSRLYLSDLFVHGIGGMKYDEMTDELIRQFYKLTPPPLMLATGTVWLPIDADVDTSHDAAAEIEKRLRQSEMTPEMFLTPVQLQDPHIQTIVAEIEALLARQAQRPKSGLTLSQRQRLRPQHKVEYLRVKELRSKLQAAIAPQSAQLDRELSAAQTQEDQLHLAHDREYSSWLYPAETLQKFFQQI